MDEHQAPPVAEVKPSRSKSKEVAPGKLEAGSTVKDHSGHKHNSKKQKMAAAP